MKPQSETLKRAAAAYALAMVGDGMTVGLGTGSTAEQFLELLAARVRDGLKVIGAATSERSARIAGALGIPVAPLDAIAPLDITVDGADEADRDRNLVKGGGGALLREKLVAASSRKMVAIMDEIKLVARLGRFPLPVEVVEFGHAGTALRLARAAAEIGYPDIAVKLRAKDGVPFRTDCGNVIYDCRFGAITDIPALASALSSVTGVVEHGLFSGLTTACVVARREGIECLE